jgi:hypothetical protein
MFQPDSRTFALSAGFCACLFLAAAQDQNSSRRLSLAEQEDFLRTAKVVERHTISEGVTGPVRATLERDGFRHDAEIQTIEVSKTQFEGRRGSEMNFRDSYKYNVAAYELAKLLGIEDMFPPSVDRRVSGSSAALTWWVDDVLMTETKRLRDKTSPPDLDRWNAQMHVVRVFDQLIFNTDRNTGNLVIDKNWDIHMIDHTRAFRIRHDLQGKENLARCDRGLLAKMRELNQQTLKETMGKLLTGMEIDGLLARRDKIVQFFEEKIKEKGEAAVLYDRPRLGSS